MIQRTKVRLHSHFCVVQNPMPNIIPAIYHLSSEYTQFGYEFNKQTRKQDWKPLKTFAMYIDHGREFRFHISQWEELQEILDRSGVTRAEYDVEVVPLKKPCKLPLKVREQWVPREKQEEAISFILDDSEPNNSPLINIPMGEGKTLLSLVATARRGYRFAIIVLAQYVDKWVNDITETLELEKSDVGVIQGSGILERTTLYPESGKPIPSAFVISISTLNSWYGTYEKDKNDPSLERFSCAVDELMEHLGIGTVIFDEVHLHPHVIYRTTCFLHVEKAIALSATMLARDRVLQRIQGKMFPRERRYDGITMKRYITTYACAYSINNFNQSKIVTKEHGRTTYSQSAFEKSILRHKTLANQYLNMILRRIEDIYIEDREEGDKLIVFVGTAKMANAVLAGVKKHWPHLDSRTYLEGDPYENVIEPDIRVTTIISGGTGVDIKGLTRSLMTNSVDSPISNVQALGRLRFIEGKETEFHYLYCTNIQKQCDYHLRKVEMFKPRTKAQKEVFLGTLFP